MKLPVALLLDPLQIQIPFKLLDPYQAGIWTLKTGPKKNLLLELPSNAKYKRFVNAPNQDSVMGPA
jgi:hypothetical protein